MGEARGSKPCNSNFFILSKTPVQFFIAFVVIGFSFICVCVRVCVKKCTQNATDLWVQFFFFHTDFLLFFFFNFVVHHLHQTEFIERCAGGGFTTFSYSVNGSSVR